MVLVAFYGHTHALVIYLPSGDLVSGMTTSRNPFIRSVLVGAVALLAIVASSTAALASETADPVAVTVTDDAALPGDAVSLTMCRANWTSGYIQA